MARVVVIGGGFAGMASAARLAKRGHDVTLVERLPQLGGAVQQIESEGFAWETGPTATLLPAVIRDLFRKSGRPLEREIDLVPEPLIREHRFTDGSAVSLPGGSRGVQMDAVDALGPGLGEQWANYVAGFADEWDLLRRTYFERPWRPEVTDKAVSDLLFTRTSLAKRTKKAFKDDRLRALAQHNAVFEGHDPRDVPGWVGLLSYVEQNFGSWTVPGGLSRLSGALASRLETRKVNVQTGVAVRDIVLREGRAVAVTTDAGDLDADHVVCAIDPRGIPALAEHVKRTLPALPPVACHLGLSGDDLPDLPHEVVFHGDPMLVVRTTGRAPDGAQAWTVLGRGLLAEDIVLALARRGINVRPHVEVRVDRSPRAQVEHWHSSPMGVLWQGRSTLKNKISTRTPVPGVYAAGAHTVPGAGLPWVGLSAALVAQEIDEAVASS